MLELILIACVTHFPDGSIVDIEGVCQQRSPAPVVQTQSEPVIDREFLDRQKEFDSEFNDLYRRLWVQSYCETPHLAEVNRQLNASKQARAITMQANNLHTFFFVPHIDNMEWLQRYIREYGC